MSWAVFKMFEFSCEFRSTPGSHRACVLVAPLDAWCYINSHVALNSRPAVHWWFLNVISESLCFDLCQTSELPQGLETSFQQIRPEPDKNTKGKLTCDPSDVAHPKVSVHDLGLIFLSCQ